ncbi:glycosyltransferase family 39 protein, partial [bacterium]|nr:glycosyltransferase family 39 protein [bacterium]
LRIPAARFATPYSYYWDESSYVNAAHSMLYNKSLKYTWFNVPPFYLYQQIFANAAHYAWALASGHMDSLDDVHIHTGLLDRSIVPSTLLFACRLYTIGLSLCSVWLVYLLGRRIANEAVGLTAAFLLAIAPGFIEHSLFVTMDLPLAFMALWTVYASLSMAAKPTIRAYLCVSILCGLTAATKYNGAVIWLLPFLLHIKHFKWRCLNARLFLIVAGIFFAFSLGCPWWNSIPDFIRQVNIEILHYGRDIEYLTGSSMYGYAFLRAWALGGFGALPLLFTLGGMIAFAWSPSRYRTVALTFPLVYFAMLAVQKADFVRNAVALFPFLALFAAYGIVQYSGWISNGRTAVVVVLLLLVSAQPVIQGGVFSWNLSQLIDNRTQAVQWLNAHVPPGGAVLIDENLALHPEDLAQAQFEYEIAPVENWGGRDLIDYSYLMSVQEYVSEDLVKHWRYQAGDWKNEPYDLQHQYLNTAMPLHFAASQDKMMRINRFLYNLRTVKQYKPEYAFPVWSSLSLFDEGTSYHQRASVNPRVTVYQPID